MTGSQYAIGILALVLGMTLQSHAELDPLQNMSGDKKTGSDLTDHDRCPSSTLYRYVTGAVAAYGPSGDAQALAANVTNTVLKAYSGAWLTLASQTAPGEHWSYWGTNPIYTSSAFCYYATDYWVVQLTRIDLS